VSLDDFNDIEFRDFDNDFQKARRRLKKDRNYLRLCYDPLLYMRERNKSYIFGGTYLLVLDRRSYQELISEYDPLTDAMAVMVEMETLALMIKDINRGLGNIKITPEQLTIPLINSWRKKVFSRLLWSLHPFLLPIMGDRNMLEANQDMEMMDALKEILDFVNVENPSIPGHPKNS